MDAHAEVAARPQRARESTLMTIEEVAEFLRFHPATVYRLVRKGGLPAVKVGKQWRLDSETLAEWLRENTTGRSNDEGAQARHSSFGPNDLH